MSTHNDLTVDQLKEILERMSAAGHGNDKVVLPYNSGTASIGAKPTVGIVGGQAGIDWDSGKLFLHPSKALGAPDVDLLAKVHKAQQNLGRIQFLAARLGSERGGPLEDQVAQFKAALSVLEKPPTRLKNLSV